MSAVGSPVHFIVDAVEQLDVRLARVNERGTGSEQYPPAMMLALLSYSYATGVFSSRQIERSTYENVAVRVLCADTHPDHDTICAFRRHNAALLSAGFTRVRELAAHCGGKGRFEQCYNAQAAVEVDSRLIVGARVSDTPNDKQQLVPTVRCIDAAAGSVREVFVDSGSVSEEAIHKVRTAENGQPTGVTVLAAVGRSKHGCSIADLKKRADAPAPPPDAPFVQRLAHRVATTYGRTRYKLRQQTVEPVFGIIKEAMGWRRFMLRGMQKVALEWTLVSLAYNLRRLHRLSADLRHA